MMAPPPETDSAPISEAESHVMRALWQRQPQTAEELVELLGPRHGWAASTVKTLLNRLLTKGAIAAAPNGRRYSYSTHLSEQSWLARESQGLLSRLFGGRVAPLVAHLGESGALSAQDLADIRQVLAGLEAQSPNPSAQEQRP
jgi:BlaI family transcriptional regulator, penicillinase repressor